MSRRLIPQFLIFLVFFCHLLDAAGAFAQSLDQPVAGYVMRRWTTAEGLAHNGISSLTQTRDGYVWIGTANAGLMRFDGLRFDTFDMLSAPGFPGNSVWALHEDRTRTLWVGTSSGLARYRDGIFTIELIDDTVTPAVVDIREDAAGTLWLATPSQLARWDGERWTTVHRVDGEGVTRILPAADGTIWIAGPRRVIAWRNGQARTFSLRDGLPDGVVRALHLDPDGRLWIGTMAGLASLGPGEAARIERDATMTAPVTALLADRRGVLWIGSLGRLFARAPDGSLTESRVAAHADAGQVERFMEDAEGHVWFGMTEGRGGLHRLSRERVTTVAREHGLPCDNVGAIAEAPDGTIWLATSCRDGRGIVALRAGTVTLHAGPTFIESLLVEPDGQVWSGSFLGEVFHFDAATRRFVAYSTPIRAEGVGIAAIYRHTDGALWFGTSRGLFRQHNGTWSRLGAADGLATDDVRTIVPGPDGALWIGGDNAVTHYAGGRFTVYGVAEQLPPGPVRAIHVDADGVVWLGTYGGGLARLKEGTITPFGVQGGVLDSAVHRIIEDQAGYLWLSGDRGIRRVAKRELNEIADGRTVVPAVTIYAEADGMRSVECNGMAQPAGWRLRDGTLQFPTQLGVVAIDPSRIGEDTLPAPLPRIERATIDGAAHAAVTTVTAAAGYRDLEFEYTAPAFARPDHVQFRYRLDGHDADWIEAGTRRIAHYSHLPPGAYRFQVTARHSGGAWQAQAAAVEVVLEPRWYQRLPVQLTIAALIVLAAVGLTRLRVASLRQRARELEIAVTERTVEVAQQRDAVRAAHDKLALAHGELAAAKSEVEQAHGQVLAVLNQLDIGVLVLNHAGTVRYASESAQRLLGKNAAEMTHRSWVACLPLVESDQALVKARVEAPSQVGARVPVQMVLGGKRYWMEVDVRDEPHPGTGRILYIYNVTEMSTMPAPGGRIDGPHSIVGRSTPMHVVFRQIRDVARVDATVLIEGETGSGKELVARAIHRGSQRGDKPFIAINGAGLAESILASQLFGHRRGAFTGAVADQIGVFEAANGGTLFLDEIGDIPMSVQVSLLRVLQEREIIRIGESHARRLNVRFLAATHRDLTREVAAGRFREDLLYRIRVATIRVPALRDRLDDLPLLVDAFLAQGARQTARPIPEMSREAMAALMRHAWPGNVRELRGVIEQTLLRQTSGVIRVEDLPEEFSGVETAMAVAGDNERERLVDALRRADGNRSEAARLLGIGRSTLYRKLAVHGLDAES